MTRETLRVLNVIDGPGWSGGVEQTLLLARGLRDRGIDAAIACHSGNTVMLREAPAHDVPVHGFETGSKRNPANYRRVMARARGADVVIGHKPKSVMYALAARRFLPHHPKVVAVRRVSRPISFLSSHTKYRWPDRVVAVSDNVARLLGEAGIPADKVRTIPSGVDLTRFRPRPDERDAVRKELGLSPDHRAIAQVANFTDKKGHRFLMAAIARLGDRARDVRLVLAGRATDSAAARDLAREHGLEERVIGLGLRRDVERLLAGMDVFAFPSIPGIEAIAGSVLQAMASGLPVVASAVGGIPEYVEDGVTGLLAPPGDVPALADALDRMLALDEDARGGMAGRGAETVRSGYGIDTTVARYVEMLGEMVPAHR